MLCKINSDLTALNDAGAIQGMDAREDGVYITYTPVAGADAVTKKLGSNPMIVKNLYFSLTRNQHPDGGQIGAVGLGRDLRFTFDVSKYNSMVVGTVATTQTNTYDRSTVYYSLDGGNNISLTTNLAVDISANSTVTINPGPTAYGNLMSGAYGLVTISSIIFS